MRLFVVTQDEPLYAPRYLAAILDALDGRHDVVGVTALDPAGPLGWRALVRQRLAMYGPVDFVRAALRFGLARARALLPGGECCSVARLAAARGIPEVATADVNDAAYVRSVRDLRPDLLVSVAANQRFGAELLAAPGTVALNVHSSLLPRHRGLDGLFWALVEGDDEVGVTVHEMSAELDAGAIVGQRRIAVGPEDTLHELYLSALRVGASLLAEAADAYAAGSVTGAPNDPAAGCYHSWPTAAAGRRFRAQGRRFF